MFVINIAINLYLNFILQGQSIKKISPVASTPKKTRAFPPNMYDNINNVQITDKK